MSQKNISNSQKPYTDYIGYHRHQCPKCGNIWEHSDGALKNKALHTCCGETEWNPYIGPKEPDEKANP